MRTVILYYSRTGNTRNVAETLAATLGADLEEIRDTRDRSGLLGYVRAAHDAMRKRSAEVEPLGLTVADYDLVVIGTPVWAFTMTPAVRQILETQRDNLRAVAFFCTTGDSGMARTFRDMESVCGRAPRAVMSLTRRELREDEMAGKVAAFAAALTAPQVPE